MSTGGVLRPVKVVRTLVGRTVLCQLDGFSVFEMAYLAVARLMSTDP